MKKGLILADLQYPAHNRKLLKNVERYMSSSRWDYLIYLGDFMDMDAISHHAMEKGNFRALEGKRLKRDYEEAAKILKRHRKIVGKKCHITFFLGNHEEWGRKFVDKYPTLEGMIEPEKVLPLKELGIEVIEPRHLKKIGKMHFIHGDIHGGSFVSATHAKKIVEVYNRNVIYGHHHTQQAYTKLSPAGIHETHTAFCLPCLADTSPEWAGDRPNAWLNGFGVFLVSPTNFHLSTVVAVRNSFITPDGKEYK